MFKRFPQKLFIGFYSSAVLFDDSELKELTPSTSATYLDVIKDNKLYFSERIQQSEHVNSVFCCCKDFLAFVGETSFLLIIVVVSFFVLLCLKVWSFQRSSSSSSFLEIKQGSYRGFKQVVQNNVLIFMDIQHVHYTNTQ